MRLAFLQRLLADRQAGKTLPLEFYQSLYPGFEAQVRAEFARLSEGAAPAAVPETATTVAHYRLVRKLGSGGQGSVWEAEDTRLRRRVAVKLLTGLATISESALSRFRREAEAASRLQHPGICTVYERGDDHGVPFLAMALVPGVSLAEHLARGEKLAVRLERAAAGLSRSRRRVRPRA